MFKQSSHMRIREKCKNLGFQTTKRYIEPLRVLESNKVAETPTKLLFLAFLAI